MHAKSPSICEESGLQPGVEHQTESDTQDQDPDLSDSSSLDVPVSTESHQSDGATSINTHTERLMPAEPHQPRLQFPKRTFGKQKRSFLANWFVQYPWIHYIQEEDCVLCFYCTTAVQRKYPPTRNADEVFTKTGFNNWQKALQKFNKHEQSRCHRSAVEFVAKGSQNVGDMLSSAYKKEREDDRRALYTILTTIRFLARQGLPLRGSFAGSGLGEPNSNLIQLLHLRKHDIPALGPWLEKAQDRFTSPSIQNELLEIMANTVLRKISSNISGKMFSIMVDETTDISNTEQLVFLHSLCR